LRILEEKWRKLDQLDQKYQDYVKKGIVNPNKIEPVPDLLEQSRLFREQKEKLEQERIKERLEREREKFGEPFHGSLIPKSFSYYPLQAEREIIK
jgi:hypothetical protein